LDGFVHFTGSLFVGTHLDNAVLLVDLSSDSVFENELREETADLTFLKLHLRGKES
jgi:hypothetical protein